MRVGSRPLSGPPEVSSQGSKVAESRTAGAASDASPSATEACASAAGICDAQACQSASDSPHGSTAPNGQLRAVPPPSIASASASLASAS